MEYKWNEDKNKWLLENRNISFQMIVDAIKAGKDIKTSDHHNQKKYPNQQIIYLNINNSIYLVPFVRDKNIIFFKTAYKSSKVTKKYIK